MVRFHHIFLISFIFLWNFSINASTNSSLEDIFSLPDKSVPAFNEQQYNEFSLLARDIYSQKLKHVKGYVNNGFMEAYPNYFVEFLEEAQTKIPVPIIEDVARSLDEERRLLKKFLEKNYHDFYYLQSLIPSNRLNNIEREIYQEAFKNILFEYQHYNIDISNFEKWANFIKAQKRRYIILEKDIAYLIKRKTIAGQKFTSTWLNHENLIKSFKGNTFFNTNNPETLILVKSMLNELYPK